MKCIIPSAKAFYKLLNFIAQFETNVKITCQKAGMSVFCMSACHSVFIDLKIDPSYYTKYQCEEEEEIGINLAGWFLLKVTHTIFKKFKNYIVLI